LPNLPKQNGSITNVSFLATPAIGNIDNDAGKTLEIAWGGDNNAAPATAALTVYSFATNSFWFTHPLTGIDVGMGAQYPRTSAIALANVAGDGKKEIFMAYANRTADRGEILQYNTQGAAITIYQMNNGEFMGYGGTVTTEVVVSSPTLGNLDNTGAPELVIGGTDGKVYIWTTTSLSGNVLAPSTYPPTGTEPITSAPALAYLTSDTALDIVVANKTGTIYVIRGGTKAVQWEKSLGAAPIVSPLIADVDGDNFNEVVVARMRSGQVFVLKADGAIAQNLTAGMGTTFQMSASPAIGDLDRDGAYEIGGADEQRLYLWSINLPLLLPLNQLNTIIGWPFFRGNIHRDGVITTANVYPLDVIEATDLDLDSWPTFKIKYIRVQNRGSGEAREVALKYTSPLTQAGCTLNSPAAPYILYAGTIAPGATVYTPALEFDCSAYTTGGNILLYFDITYKDAAGNEYLVHR